MGVPTTIVYEGQPHLRSESYGASLLSPLALHLSQRTYSEQGSAHGKNVTRCAFTVTQHVPNFENILCMPILTYPTFLPLCNSSSYRPSINPMPSKSNANTSDEPRRKSARLASAVVIDADGKARSEENSNNKKKNEADDTPKITVHEEGQDLNQNEIDAVNAHIVAGGCTELVDPSKWKDHASLEHAQFHDKMMHLKQTLESKLTDEEKEMYQDALESYEHAMRIDFKKELDKKDSAGSSSDDKHESVVATAGANAHMAAITAGKSTYSADASMANAMGKQEENYLSKLMSKRDELEMEINAAKKVATGYHANELIATAKDVSQEAADKADKVGTRHNKSEAEKRKQEADALENVIGGASGSASTGEIVIPPHLALTMPKHVQSVATTLGFDVQNPDESEDAPNQAKNAKTSKKKPLSSKARGKLPAGADDGLDDEEMKNVDDDDEDGDEDGDAEDDPQNNQQLGIMSGSSKKRGKKRERANADGDEPPKEKKKRAVDPNKIPASQHYSDLGIKNSSQLGDIVTRLKDYQEKVDELTEHNKRLAKIEKQVDKFSDRESNLRAKHSQTCEMYNKAIQYLVNECQIPKSVLIEKGIAHRSKK